MLPRYRSVPLTALATLLAAVPAVAQSGAGNMAGMKMDHATSFMAMLAPPAGATGLRGMVMVNDAAVQLTISGGKAGDALPWHVHKGACGDDKGIVEATGGYVPASVGADGRGAAKATLGAPLASEGKYFVAVHASTSDMKTIVACAALKPGKM